MSSFDTSTQTLSSRGLPHQSYSSPSESDPDLTCNVLRKSELSKNLSVHITNTGPVLEGHGTPSYPSPLDRIRTGRRERAAQFGLKANLQESFEANQSFPKAKKSLINDVPKPAAKVKLCDFKGHGLNDVSFSAGHSRGSFMSQSDGGGDDAATTSLSDSWSFYKYIGHSSSRVTFPTTVRNPNKAICMVNATTSQILIVNEMACELFGYREEELLTMRLRDLIKLKARQQTSISESHVEESTGSVVEVSGKVVDAIDYTGLCVPISLWVKTLPNEDEPRCLVIMEPVERTVATVQFDTQGVIVSCDSAMRNLYGYSQSDDITGLHINDFIPALKLPTSPQDIPKEISKQRATGRSRAGGTFPLSIALRVSNKQLNNTEASPECVYDGVVWVFANISGLITFLHDGTIHSINDNFSLMMFGYTPDELLGKDISMLIPDFYKIIEQENESFMSLTNRRGNLTRETSGQVSGHVSGGTSLGNSLEDGTETSFVTISDSSECTTSTPSRPSNVDSCKNLTTDPCSEQKSGLNPKLRTMLKQSAHSSVEFSGPVTSTPDLKHTPPNSMDYLNHETSPTPVINDAVVRGDDNEVEHLDVEEFSNGDIPIEAASIASTFSTYRPASKLRVVKAKHPSLDRGPSRLERMALCTRSLNVDGSNVGDNLDREVEHLSVSSDGKLVTVNNALNTNNNNVKGGVAVRRPDILESSDLSSCTESPVKGCVSDGVSPVAMDTPSRCHDPAQDTPCNLSSSHSSQKLGRRSPKHRRKLTGTPHQNWRSVSDARSSLSPSPTCSGDGRQQFSARRTKLTKSPNFLTVDSPCEYYDGYDAPSITAGRGFCVNVTPPPVKYEPWSFHRRMLGDTPADSSTDSINSDHRHQLRDAQRNRPSSDDENASDDQTGPMKRTVQTELFHKMMSRHALFARTGRSKAVCASADGDLSPDAEKSRSPARTPPIISSLSQDATSKQLIRQALRGKYLKCGGGDCSEDSGDRLVDVNRCGSSDKSGNTSMDDAPSINLTHQTSLTGNFCGYCRHRDGSHLGVVFQIKRVTLEDGTVVFCIWMSRDPEDLGEGGRSYANLTLASSLYSLANVSTEVLDQSKLSSQDPGTNKDTAPRDTHEPNRDDASSHRDAVVPSNKDNVVTNLYEGRGQYNVQYQTLRCIGKGAYGFVRLAQRITDWQQVVVKFIRRSKIQPDRWSHDPVYGYCPVEVSLLSQLNHPNIVKIVDVYHNEDFYQMVMEKHGSGMDMFEFIDRAPNLDEALGSYLFRQLVSAASYLHSKGILHRDIKDENVILDETFHIKLIDFGAATFMSPGKLFATFCGTLEYCSPEVLLGNKYRGPELEVWSLGVTLYTLIFGENPFYDHDETIECILKPPFPVSNALMFLLTWMLHRDPDTRMTLSRVNHNSWVNQPIDISIYDWHDVLPNSEFYGNTASDNRSEQTDGTPHSYVPPGHDWQYHSLPAELTRCLNVGDVPLSQRRDFYDEAFVR